MKGDRPTSQGAAARPKPRLASWLSVVLPGAGQAYLGQWPLAFLFAAAWILSILGMLDVLTTFRGSPYQIPFGICAGLLGGGAWFLSTALAHRRARAMTAHASLYRRIARNPLLRVLFLEEWPDLLQSLGFALIATGHFARIPSAQKIAVLIMWWWPYEILGILFLVLYLVFLEGMARKLGRRRHRFILLVALYAGLAAALHLVFRIPLKALTASGLILLPGYASVLIFGRPAERARFLNKAGRSLGVFFISFIPLAFLASLFERPGVKTAGRAIFEGSVMVMWGAFYFLARAALESLYRTAATRQGREKDSPRNGEDAEFR